MQVSVDSGGFANASGTNNWTFGLATGSLSNGSHTLTAQAIDAAGISATSAPVAITVEQWLLQLCRLHALCFAFGK